MGWVGFEGRDERGPDIVAISSAVVGHWRKFGRAGKLECRVGVGRSGVVSTAKAGEVDVKQGGRGGTVGGREGQGDRPGGDGGSS